MACSSPADVPEPQSSDPQVRLPRPALAWNEEFAANTTLERITVGERPLLVPQGLRLPEDAHVTAVTEATLVLADDDPSSLVHAVERSCDENGYEAYASGENFKVWLGNGMVIRLETSPGAQVLAWAPEAMKDSFVDQT